MAIEKLNYRFASREILTHEKMQGLADKVDELVDGLEGAVDAAEVVAGANFGGGVVYAEKYGNDFETALNAAIAASVAEGRAFTTIDCTYFTGRWVFRETVVIETPVTIRLGNVHIVSHGENVFDVRSNNVRIEGVNRSTDRTVTEVPNMTVVELDQSGLDVTVWNDGRKGYHIWSHGNKNCQYRNMFLLGRRTTLGRQCGNAAHPINGWGGVHIEPEVPCTTISGNTVNATVLENLLIDGTKAHGIYLDTPILSFVRNCRLSSVAGHGVFVNGGTTTMLENVYVASCQLAGFCLWGVTYCAVLNSVAEYCGIGWWIRSSFSVSIFAPGVEHAVSSGYNLWEGTKTAETKYGFNIVTQDGNGTSYRVNDVPNDSVNMGGVNVHYRNMFVGIGYLVTGGRNIDIYSPYVTGIGFDPENVAANEVVRPHHRYLAVLGNARAVNVSNAGFSGGAASEGAHKTLFGQGMRYEVEIGAAANGVDLSFNPNNTTLLEDGVSGEIEVMTSNTARRAQILNQCVNALVRFGNVYYTPVRFAGGLSFDGNFAVSGALAVGGQISTDTGIVWKGYLREDTSDRLTVGVTYSPGEQVIAWNEEGVTLALVFTAMLGETDVTAGATYRVYVNGSLYGTYVNVGSAAVELLSEGEYEVYVVASYTDAGGAVKTATSETHRVVYRGEEVVQPTFVEVESVVYEETAFTCVFSVRSSFEITNAGAAYSPSNTSPTVSQNNAVASSVVQDGELWRVTVTVPRRNASQTRYVRFYYATNDTEAGTTERQYSETYVVTGSSCELYEG